MRLKQIKLAGFKSFVDPTTVPFPSNLTAVVGPNGCGKSNIIDAVRWVMGESSAKNLRGDDMTDVIFNGSLNRKPVGQAGIELVFDNSEGKLIGQYANFNEVAIKRTVNRERQSQYFINQARCRRRDITDIFLGTGLGPRSYAIIEQGMISRLIESKPHELRVFIEEAAGISKYKERRRETENRVRHTRENLERLSDVRDELEKRLSHLKRQASAAEKYKALKEDEKLLKVQIATLRWMDLTDQVDNITKTISAGMVEREAVEAQMMSGSAEFEQLRLDFSEAQDAFSTIQGQYYQVGSNIASVEQKIRHAEERHRQLLQEQEQLEEQVRHNDEELRFDRQRLDDVEVMLIELEPEYEEATAIAEETMVQQEMLEGELEAWQMEWEAVTEKLNTSNQHTLMLKSKIQHQEENLQRTGERRQALNIENEGIYFDGLVEECETLTAQLEEAEQRLEQCKESQQHKHEQLDIVRGQLKDAAAQTNQLQHQLNRSESEAASLKVLLDAASQSTLVDEQSDDSHQCLINVLEVNAEWDVAVQAALGKLLTAPLYDQVEQLQLDGFLGAGILTESNTDNISVADDSLCHQVSCSELDLRRILGGFRGCESLEIAVSQRHALRAGEIWVTSQGELCGPDWIIGKAQDATQNLLAQQRRLTTLNEQQQMLEDKIAQAEEKREALDNNASLLEQELRLLESDNHQVQIELRQLGQQLASKEQERVQKAQRQSRLTEELEQLAEQLELGQEQLATLRGELEDAIEQMFEVQERQNAMRETREQDKGRLESLRQTAMRERERAHQLRVKVETLKTEQNSLKTSYQRLLRQSEQIVAKKARIDLELSEASSPQDDYKMELETLLESRIDIEGQLSEARDKLAGLEAIMRDSEQARFHFEQKKQQIQAQIQQLEVEREGVKVRAQAQMDLIQQSSFQLKDVQELIPEGANENERVRELDRVQDAIGRLGAINLAAIEEYQSQSERKEYLDSQHIDLVEALDTLENAIRKIDRETRQKFKATFDKINDGLQNLFPRVFGGGRAYIELTDDDLLNTGVAIMAQPPGKRNSTIHLLSGGEKALTALSLVFAIFKLNPAPFCMLDEVDAPLDDANVERFCNLVKSMADQVQFIFISHNKVAMEMAHQLTGVTMHEPGVSRMVAVDVEEAAALATA